MKILVTGAAGFIGFHLAKKLLQDGHDVVGVDNFNDYYSVQLKRDRAAVLKKYDRYSEMEADLTDYSGLEKVFAGHGFRRVCHLAAQAGVRYSLEHPFAYLKSNLEGFLNILELCRKFHVERLVYASSSSVYGGNEKLPFSETDSVDSPLSLYAATKKADELMAHCYHHLYGIQMIGLRFFTVYGPWGRPDMAMWLFTEAMTKGEPIRVFNNGDMKRDFTYIDDIINGVTASIFSDRLDGYEIINLGNHRPERLMDMIHIIARELGVKPVLKMLPMQPGDVYATYADIRRAGEKLDFHPRTPIEEGIPRFISWFKRYFDI